MNKQTNSAGLLTIFNGTQDLPVHYEKLHQVTEFMILFPYEQVKCTAVYECKATYILQSAEGCILIEMFNLHKIVIDT